MLQLVCVFPQLFSYKVVVGTFDIPSAAAADGAAATASATLGAGF